MDALATLALIALASWIICTGLSSFRDAKRNYQRTTTRGVTGFLSDRIFDRPHTTPRSVVRWGRQLTTHSGPPKQGRRLALVIGINYTNVPALKLGGCIADAKQIAQLYHRLFDVHQTLLLTDDTDIKPTAQNIANAIHWLTANAQDGDLLLFHYSGHGTQVSAERSNTEQDGLDETIVPLPENPRGGITRIRDDDLARQLVLPLLPTSATLFCSFDCCHSASILDLFIKYTASSRHVNTTLLATPTMQQLPFTVPTDTRANVYCISACQDEQTAGDTPAGGYLSRGLVEVWGKDRYQPWNRLVDGLQHYVDERCPGSDRQRVQLCSLRVVDPLSICLT